MEQYFRDFKRGNRRKTGNNSSSLMLQSMLAQTPLVRNLQNSEYMKILLDGKTTIEDVLNEPQYPEKLANLLKKSESQPKSNQILRS